MKSLWKGGVYVSGATLIWQLSNFAFNALGARALGPSQYSILAAAVGMLYLFNPLVSAVQTVASREATTLTVTDDGSEIRALVRFYIARVGVAAGLLALVVAALSPFISDLLRLDSATLVILFALAIPTTICSVLVRGVHQGTRRFGRYSLGTTAEGLSKIAVAGLFFGFVWKSPTAGMMAVVVSAAVGLVVNVLLLRHWPRPAGPSRPVSHPWRYSVTTFGVFTLLAILLSIDTIAARRFLRPHLAGLYAGVSLTGKIVYFVVAAMATFLFPLFSARHDAGEPTEGWLIRSLGAVTAVCAAIVLVYALAPGLMVTALLGSKYARYEGYSAWMGAVFATYSLAYLLVMYLLARRARGVTFVLTLAVLSQIGGLLLFHRTIDDFMLVLTVAFAVAALGCGVLALRPSRRTSTGADFAGDLTAETGTLPLNVPLA
jgi:O-antigen/teichoic acid export membrane protein